MQKVLHYTQMKKNNGNCRALCVTRKCNNYRKEIKNQNAIQACKHLLKASKYYHDFDNHVKFTLTEQLGNIKTASTETLKERLKQQDKFSIVKHEALAPHDLNQELT